MAGRVGIPILLEALKGEGVDAGAGLQPNAIENTLEVDVGKGEGSYAVGLGRIRWSVFATYESRDMSSNKRSPPAAQAQRLFAPLNPYSITGASL
jgi:hypothetical protein